MEAYLKLLSIFALLTITTNTRAEKNSDSGVSGLKEDYLWAAYRDGWEYESINNRKIYPQDIQSRGSEIWVTGKMEVQHHYASREYSVHQFASRIMRGDTIRTLTNEVARAKDYRDRHIRVALSNPTFEDSEAGINFARALWYTYSPQDKYSFPSGERRFPKDKWYTKARRASEGDDVWLNSEHAYIAGDDYYHSKEGLRVRSGHIMSNSHGFFALHHSLTGKAVDYCYDNTLALSEVEPEEKSEQTILDNRSPFTHVFNVQMDDSGNVYVLGKVSPEPHFDLSEKYSKLRNDGYRVPLVCERYNYFYDEGVFVIKYDSKLERQWVMPALEHINAKMIIRAGHLYLFTNDKTVGKFSLESGEKLQDYQFNLSLVKDFDVDHEGSIYGVYGRFIEKLKVDGESEWKTSGNINMSASKIAVAKVPGESSLQIGILDVKGDGVRYFFK